MCPLPLHLAPQTLPSSSSSRHDRPRVVSCPGPGGARSRAGSAVRADVALFQEEDDYDVMQDPEFLQSVLENLPGVDPNNEAIRNAMGSLASQATQATKDVKKDKKEEDKK